MVDEMPAPPGAPVTNDPLLREFNSLWRRIDGAYHGVCASFGLSGSSFDILYALYALGEGCLQRDICDQLFLGKQTVNSSIHKLAAQGYLVLDKAPRGRGKRIWLTDEGRALMRRCIEPVAQAELDTMLALPADECEYLLRAARDYVDELQGRFAAIAAGER